MDSQHKPVLLVTTSTFPRWKGDSEPRFVFDLSTRLTKYFKVLVLAPHYTGAARHEKWRELEVYRYQYAPAALEKLAYNGGVTANLRQKKWRWLLLPGFFLSQWWAIYQLVKHHSVSIIHAHWLIPQGLTAVLATRWLANKPALLCTSHGGDLYGLQDKFSQRLKRWVIRHCQAVTVVSSPMVKKILELSNEHAPTIKVIPMGTDLEHTFIPSLTIQRRPGQLLFVGRLVEKKGLTYLLQALKKVHQIHADTTLVVAGSGPLQDKLEKLTSELGLDKHVNFVGRLEHKSLVKLYQESTLAVFPFIQAKDGDMEGLGLVVVEALGCGCPVIASDLPVVRDIIKNEETGYLTEPSNPSALANGITHCLSNTASQKHLSNRQFSLAPTEFSWNAVMRDYSTLISQLILTDRVQPTTDSQMT